MNSTSHINFICIGAQRAGTTWLHARLEEIPDFFLPFRKEIHYFDRDRCYPSPSYRSKKSFLRRNINPKRLYLNLEDIFKSFKKNRDFKELKWLLKSHFGYYNDDWYLSLFDYPEKICGEVCPAYAILNKSDIQKMHSLLPNIKIIFLLRNPIERAWSQFKYFHSNSINYTNEYIKDFIYSNNQSLRSDYRKTLNNYLEYFDGNQILIGFYDSLIYNPKKLIKDIVKFVNGNPEDVEKYCNLGKRNLISEFKEIPVEINNYLNDLYGEELKVLSKIFPGYCSDWNKESSNIDKLNFNNHITTYTGKHYLYSLKSL